jgi:hypothetical protein
MSVFTIPVMAGHIFSLLPRIFHLAPCPALILHAKEERQEIDAVLIGSIDAVPFRSVSGDHMPLQILLWENPL